MPLPMVCFACCKFVEHVGSSRIPERPCLEPLVDIIEYMYKAVQASDQCIVISIERHGTLVCRTLSNRDTLLPGQQPSALARRLSDELSDNRHGQWWTSADTDGRSAASP